MQYEYNYLNKFINGNAREYYKSGKLLYEGKYSNGKRNGNGKEYNEFGKLLFEGEYLNGKKWNGKIKEYDLNNGEIIFDGIVKDGEIINNEWLF